jgi:hypothetical protein
MFEKHVKNMNYQCRVVYFPKIELKHNPNLPNCVIFDIDGTLALNKGKRGFYEWHKVGNDDVNEPIRNLYNMIARTRADNKQPHIIIFSGRDGSCEEETKQWLSNHNINYDALYMRKSKDSRNDSVVKQEMYDEYIKNKYNVLFIVDDRDRVVEMWRRNGLTCLQVNFGDF